MTMSPNTNCFAQFCQSWSTINYVEKYSLV